MARIRTIKPSFFQSEDVSVLPLRARLTWIGLWTHCDDQGRCKDNVRLIKAAVWPLDDVSLRELEEDLDTLAGAGRIVRYESDGQRCLEITNWSDHQAINRPTPSKLPPPPLNGSAVNGHAPLTEHSRQEGKGRERKGTRARARDVSKPIAPHRYRDAGDGMACTECPLPRINKIHPA
ncbi:MAG TPA: hypothetical protein VFY84_19805 [Jiangellales bacterium]|nr:hypothetical protein [Jiangellales bacterium]